MLQLKSYLRVSVGVLLQNVLLGSRLRGAVPLAPAIKPLMSTGNVQLFHIAKEAILTHARMLVYARVPHILTRFSAHKCTKERDPELL